ncbi:HlyD family type I secretion periplasmic adaptor subunit [Planktomarina sp.]|nr:HlyD family type I secretion periplasmic adaptor subunit [Planktomarina sp.]
MSDIEFKALAKEMSGKQRSSSSILLLSIVTLLVLIFLWASITELDNVVRGSGKTVSEAQNQLVQSSEPGVIRKRYVEEGDLVKKGDLLFDIDPVDAKTQLDQVQKRSAALLIKQIRLEAEVVNAIPNFQQDLVETAPASFSTELALFKARRNDLQAGAAILEQRKIQKLNEIQELKIKYETAQNGLLLIRREIETIEPLVKNGLAPETRLIGLRRDEAAMLGQANSAESSQNRVLSGLEEIKEQLKAEKQAYVTRALTDLSTIEGEITDLTARIPALESRVERTSVRAPLDGVINQLNYVTADAYIRTGEVLLEMVPTGSDLIVETKIDPKDIGEIVLGQDVKISLTAYDASRYGRIDGDVLGISADAISDEQSGQQYYLVDVSIKSQLYESDGGEVTILPGMVASIDVLSGKRTILDYFWQPMAKAKGRALRD